jgi:fumarate reductase flavoprotein subunit
MTEDAKKTAIASIKRYSDLAVNGKDEDFGKAAARLSKLQTPPYYAAKFGMAGLLVTHGGLENDHELRVFDKDRKIIPGLYACGNVQSGRYAVQYPITVPGCSHASALTFGRLAGQNAAKSV